MYLWAALNAWTCVQLLFYTGQVILGDSSKFLGHDTCPIITNKFFHDYKLRTPKYTRQETT